MEFVKSADVVVIGGGIVGTAVLRELSKYDLKCVLIEKEPDIALGTTKANSAILHAGFDAPTGSLKAITNVRGNRLYHELEKDLDLDIKWTGSLVAATTDEEMQTLQELMQRGRANGVEGLHGAEVRACDLRAGAAVVIAGLCATGETVVTDIRFIERGYENFVGKLRGVGADIVLERDGAEQCAAAAAE